MLVKIAHSIDSDEVLSFIADLLTKQSNMLNVLSIELEDVVKDMRNKNSAMDALDYIGKLREEMYDIDVALDESKQILIGYTQNLLMRSDPRLFQQQEESKEH